MSNPRIFEVEEANGVITALEPKLFKLKEKQRVMQAQHDQLLVLELLVGEEGIDYETKDGQEYLKRSQELETLIVSFEQDIIEINSLGCVLKDIERQFVDFFHVRSRELVYLCWRSGELKVSYWHDLEAECDTRKRF